MTAEDFSLLAERLTGTRVKGIQPGDIAILNSILADDSKRLDCSQFNELLLLVNKNRVGRGFFEYFFGPHPSVGELAAGVDRFRRLAMLSFGNFIYAFRSLSSLMAAAEVPMALEGWARLPDEAHATFAERAPKLADIHLIPDDQTPFLGYLTGKRHVAALSRVERLLEAADGLPTGADLGLLESAVTATIPDSQAAEREVYAALVRAWRKRAPASTIGPFLKELDERKAIYAARLKEAETVQRTGMENERIYLTWDQMDVYFATSMRHADEFRQVARFIRQLLADEHLRDLNLRYFDPTQAFNTARINKGLIEALMLKRAQCTVYLVQHTDTLGKDSELAATLAQGKPVIAFVPQVDEPSRAAELEALETHELLHLLRFVIYEDAECRRHVGPSLREHLVAPEAEGTVELPTAEREAIAHTVAAAERRIFDKRATTLHEGHPLSLQVNLRTGVANGVLVVRSVADCAKVLLGVLENRLEFEITEDENFWNLTEQTSGCPFRVVTKDAKLTNSFWAFYPLRQQQ